MLSSDNRFQLRLHVLLVVTFLSLGLIVRIAHLDRKVFWVDEVATALRAAGYTKQEITAALSDGAIHTPAELLRYQQLTRDRSLADAVAAFQKSPEHAPLYFLLTRFWMQLFGSSVTAIRSFSVVCSLLVLPGMYGLSWLLFGASRIAWIAVGLMAISPFFVAYAQEARPYSLWVLMLILSGATLLRAIKHNTLGSWALYGLMLSLSFYTSLLSLLVASGQGLYVAAIETFRLGQRLQRFGIVFGAALVALLPWIWIVVQSWQTVEANTTWMRMPLSSFAKVTIWFYSAAILYFDVPVITEPWPIAVIEIVVASGVVAVILYGFYKLRQQSVSQWLFILSLSLPVPLALILVDAITNGRYSTAPRYWLPFHLGAQLAVAYLLGEKLTSKYNKRLRWQSIAVFLIGLSLLSNLIHFETSPRYLKSRSLHNSSIAKIINKANRPLIISESQNTIDLLSLSHSLDQDVRLKILSADLMQQLNASLKQENSDQQAFSAANQSQFFLFNPSPEVQQRLQNTCFQLQEAYQPELLMGELSLSLWHLKLNPNC
jgi:uncharacterized membrane protein